MRRDRFKEDFLFEANSKWNLFIFTHHIISIENKNRIFFKQKILADFEIKVHLCMKRSTSCADVS